MDLYSACEEAYKKGYDKGYEAGKRDGIEHGRWRAVNRDCRGYASSFECSVCECISTQTHYERHCMFDFCPVCGSIMDWMDENDV